MDKKKIYVLPELPYGYKDLEPYISEEQLKIHHDKHHLAYVDNANAILEKLDKARREGADLDVKSVLKSLSFNVGGHLLHSLFWENLSPADKREEEAPRGILAEKIKEEFGGLERFKKEFSEAAVSAEGSGWAALVFDKTTDKLMIMQIEKHNVNIYPAFDVLMVVDVWEHAYYLDYKNDRKKFIESFWQIVNWRAVERRMGNI